MSRKSLLVGAALIALALLVGAMLLPQTTSAQSGPDWSESLILPNRTPVRLGEQVTFQIWVVNSSTVPAEDVFVYNPIPQGVEYVDVAGPGTFPIVVDGAMQTQQALQTMAYPGELSTDQAYDLAGGEVVAESTVDPEDVIAVGWAGDVHTGTIDPVLIGFTAEAVSPVPVVTDTARIYYDEQWDATITGTLALEYAQPALSPGYTQTMEQGGHLVYTHRITNVGTDRGTFAIVADAPAGWTTTLGADWVSLAAEGGRDTFTVAVEAGDESPGQVTVQATSADGLSAVVTDTVERVHRTYLPLVFNAYTPPPPPTEVITVPVTEAQIRGFSSYEPTFEEAIACDDPRAASKVLATVVDTDEYGWYRIFRSFFEVDIPDVEIVSASLSVDVNATWSMYGSRPLPTPTVYIHPGTWSGDVWDVPKEQLWDAWQERVAGSYDTTPIYGPPDNDPQSDKQRVNIPLDTSSLTPGQTARFAFRDSEDHIDWSGEDGDRRDATADPSKVWVELTIEK
jgi:uncharacterized repeat protein (TIGR01451 family)